jgi:N-acetylglucosamine-6-phosphate deacetylase
MIDLQVNGLTVEGEFHCNFWEGPKHLEIKKMCKYLFNKGVKQILATLITNSYDNIAFAMSNINAYKKRFDNSLEEATADERAHITGVHIEGGLISRLGIHSELYAKEFDFLKAGRLKHEYPGLIKLWTLCPLRDKDGDMTKFLQDNGVYVSYGHSEANFSQAMKAFEKYNVRLVTHWGNAMSIFKGLKQRDPSPEHLNYLETIDPDIVVDPDQLGLGYAAYYNDKIYTMFICGSEADKDLHIHPELLKILIKKKKDKLILVSDSVSKTIYERDDELRGGLVDLAKHANNLRDLGIPDIDIHHMVETNPLKLINSQL